MSRYETMAPPMYPLAPVTTTPEHVVESVVESVVVLELVAAVLALALSETNWRELSATARITSTTTVDWSVVGHQLALQT